jgi:hypothetical protein
MKKVLLLIAVIFSTAAAFAQMSDVTLTVIGTGATEEIATQNALRRALEDAYGAFLVSRTSIVMDELASDEIVVNTNGQIKEMKHNDISTLPNGQISVSVTATVSMQKLISYAQGKGCEVAFMGDAFVANLKMMQLKVDNATKTLKILTEQIEDLSEDLFSFELSMGSSPVLINIEGKEYYVFKGQLNVYSNYASHHFYNLLHNTLSALQLNKSELDFFVKNKLPRSNFYIKPFSNDGYFGIPIQQDTLNYYRARIMTSTYDAITRVNVQEISKNKTHDYIWNYWTENDRRRHFNSFNRANILLPQGSFKTHDFHFPIRKSLTEKEIKLVKKYKYEGSLYTDSVVNMENLITRIVFPLYIPKESMATFQGFKLNGKHVFSPASSLTPDNPQLLKFVQGYCNNVSFITDISDKKLKYHFLSDEKEVYKRMPFEFVRGIYPNEIETKYNANAKYKAIRDHYNREVAYLRIEDNRLVFDVSKLTNQDGSVGSNLGRFCAAYCFLNGIDISEEDRRFIFLTIHIDEHRPEVYIDGNQTVDLYIDSYDNNGNHHGARRIRLEKRTYNISYY